MFVKKLVLNFALGRLPDFRKTLSLVHHGKSLKYSPAIYVI